MVHIYIISLLAWYQANIHPLSHFGGEATKIYYPSETFNEKDKSISRPLKSCSAQCQNEEHAARLH